MAEKKMGRPTKAPGEVLAKVGFALRPDTVARLRETAVAFRVTQADIVESAINRELRRMNRPKK